MVRTEVKALVGVALGFMSTSLTGCGGGAPEVVDKCKAISFEVGAFDGEMKKAVEGAKIEVKCPDGHSYKGPELECGYYDKECPAGSDKNCHHFYGALKKGDALKEWPSNLAPRVIKKKKDKKDEKEEKSRRLKGSDKKEEKKDKDEPKTTTLPPLLFDCSNGNENWQMGWSIEKADYCCREISDHKCKVILPKPVKVTGDQCVEDKKSEEKFEMIAHMNLGADGPSVSAFVLGAASSFAIFGAVIAMARGRRGQAGDAREQDMSLATGEVTAEE
jgi:hypothetical protein